MTCPSQRSGQHAEPPPGDEESRWGLQAVLRQALLDLEHLSVGVVLVRLRRALDKIEEASS